MDVEQAFMMICYASKKSLDHWTKAAIFAHIQKGETSSVINYLTMQTYQDKSGYKMESLCFQMDNSSKRSVFHIFFFFNWGRIVSINNQTIGLDAYTTNSDEKDLPRTICFLRMI